MVDLDAEKGRNPRPGGPDQVYCIIKPSKPIRMAAIGAYLSGQMPFDNSVLESISELLRLILIDYADLFKTSLIMLCVKLRPKITP